MRSPFVHPHALVETDEIGPGTRVCSEGAMVGAGPVVTSDVEPHTVVVGSPARILRRLEPTP